MAAMCSRRPSKIPACGPPRSLSPDLGDEAALFEIASVDLQQEPRVRANRVCVIRQMGSIRRPDLDE
jgi:hypothetical protein